MRLVSIGGRPWAYAYDAENRLVQATLRGATALTLNYDPAGRLRRSDGEGVTEFLYDGNRLVGEYVDGTLVRRYVPGPAANETVLAYEGADKLWYYGNPHAYVGNDPINLVDPSGLLAEQAGSAAWDLTKRATAPYVDFYKGAVADPVNWLLREISYSPIGDDDFWQSIQAAGPLVAPIGAAGGAVSRGLRVYTTLGRAAPIAAVAMPEFWNLTPVELITHRNTFTVFCREFTGL